MSSKFNALVPEYLKPAPFSNRFTVPNELFQLDLTPGAIAVYVYLLYCEDRKTWQCHVSYRTIGSRVGMSVNTVKKYVMELVDKQLISTENTTYRENGLTFNGSLLYTIRPIEDVVEQYKAQAEAQVYMKIEQWKAARRLEKYDRRHPKVQLGACSSETTAASSAIEDDEREPIQF